jgi:hypothetical protein
MYSLKSACVIPMLPTSNLPDLDFHSFLFFFGRRTFPNRQIGYLPIILPDNSIHAVQEGFS